MTTLLETGLFPFSYVVNEQLNYLAGHPWVQVDGVAPDKPLDSAVLSRLKQFSAMNKLKKMALRVSFLYSSVYLTWIDFFFPVNLKEGFPCNKLICLHII